MQVADSQMAESVTSAPRQRDRRRNLGEVVATLARTLTIRNDAGSLRSVFEEALLRTLPVQAVALRDNSRPWAPDRPNDLLETLAFEVVGVTAAHRGTLEAHVDRRRRLGEWDVQLLGQAAQLGTLVLELERLRGTGAPRGSMSPPPPRSRRDGAAPLIGSTPAMTALRDRIERVASTDFTVLLEGETRAELENPIWRESARKCTDGQTAGAGKSQEVSAVWNLRVLLSR